MSQHVLPFKTLALAAAIILGLVANAKAQPKLRQHTATTAAQVALTSANRTVPGNKVAITTSGARRIITSNGLPSHAVGSFPNRGNPNRISAQSHRFVVPVSPKVGAARALARGASFGVAINGVPFDPNAAEFWLGNPRSGWDYNALGGAVSLGFDANFAHVQPSGAYHYHGLPVGLMQQLGWSASRPSPLIGYAADGFPIYALNAQVDGQVVRMTSSYQLKPGRRPGGTQPGGPHDGAFKQDYQYVAGSGTLDECNGARVVTADYPRGTYAYFLTDAYPTIPRCLRGTPGQGFGKR
ncbi:YHYH protein [Tateyamaria armeniaca]|uniref:YHYH protein n=1 Tax=Tateyamaria armeniaca TaxID=2518930 RepID=A0ABW8UUB1_9RHOB